MSAGQSKYNLDDLTFACIKVAHLYVLAWAHAKGGHHLLCQAWMNWTNACIVRNVRAKSEVFEEDVIFLACIHRIPSSYLLLQLTSNMVSSASTDDSVEDVGFAEGAFRHYRELTSSLDSGGEITNKSLFRPHTIAEASTALLISSQLQVLDLISKLILRLLLCMKSYLEFLTVIADDLWNLGGLSISFIIIFLAIYL